MPTPCHLCPTPASCAGAAACSGFACDELPLVDDLGAFVQCNLCGGTTRVGCGHVCPALKRHMENVSGVPFATPKIYLSGPMTGIPLYNKPEFKRQAEALRECGLNVLNPGALDSADPDRMEWHDYLIRDLIALLQHCRGVIVMSGWHNSKGAILECLTAAFLGFPIYHLQDALAGDWSRPVSRWTIGLAAARLAIVRPAKRLLRRAWPFKLAA